MVQIVKDPDGTTHQFPDDATPDEMSAMLSQTSTPGPAPPTTAPSPVAKGGAGGGTSWLSRAVSSAADVGRQAQGMTGRPTGEQAPAMGALLGQAAGAVKMVPGLNAITDVAEYAAGHQPEAHFGAPGPFGATAEQVRGVEQQMRGVTPVTMAKGLVEPFKQTASMFGPNAPKTFSEGYQRGQALPQAVATAEGGAAAISKGAAAIAKAVPPAARRMVNDLIESGKIKVEDIAKAGEAKAMRANAYQAQTNALKDVANKHGFGIVPAEAGTSVRKVIAKSVGESEVADTISAKNVNKVSDVAGADVGIHEPLTEKSVKSAIDEEIPKYKEITGIGRLQLRNASRAMTESTPVQTANQQAWQQGLDRVRGIDPLAEPGEPRIVKPEIEKLVAHYDRESMSAATMFRAIQQLREEAGVLYKSGTANDVFLAKAHRQLANEMEMALEREAIAQGRTDLVGSIKGSRERLAKLYTIKDIMNVDGSLDLGKLAKLYDDKEPLSGNLRDLAMLKKQFPKSFGGKALERPVTKGDIAAAGVRSAIGFAAGGVPGVVAANVLPSVGRAMLSSTKAKPIVVKPSLASRAARKITEAGKKGQTLKSLPPSETEASQ